MDSASIKRRRWRRRKAGIRKRVMGTPQQPRLTVYRSLRHIYAQIIDDLAGRTMVAANSVQGRSVGGDTKTATSVGKLLAEKAQAAGIGNVVFDRNGFKYHGRVKALADAAREGGLRF